MSVRVQFLLIVFTALVLAPVSADDVYDTPEKAKADADFSIQGEYVKDGTGIQVVAQGDGDFLIVIYTGGLPGAGWNGREKRTVEADRDDVSDLTEGCRKIERKSATLGTQAPTGAAVLFDGTQQSVADHWQEGARITDDGLLMEGLTSRDLFQDFRIHVEFRLPYMPKARGQGRGNSGLYYQGRYETQILDSFGLEGKNNETGGIYEIHDPDLNMCLPPLAWQTYDAEFRAARYEDGQKISNARLTVRLNGVTVQRDVELPRGTRAAPVPEGPEPGPIYFQDHGNPVRFRNIWVLPLDGDKEARRPLVPGFERFHAAGTGSAVAGGRLLVSTLNCASCHQADDALMPKTAPKLTDVGSRLRSDYIWKFIQDPHSIKPGTTMPGLLDDLSAGERTEAATAITSFLSTTGSFSDQNSNTGWAKNGERAFHQVGCIACHLPRNGKAANSATSIPLVSLGEKYSISGLQAFLKNPHDVRPSGRMPGFDFNDNQARDMAHYLVGPIVIEPTDPNVKYAVYHKGYEEVPDLGTIKADSTGVTSGLDVHVAGRDNDFSIRFESFFKVAATGEYTFHLGSDDGSILYIDGEVVVDVNGVHPHTVKSEKVKLEAGVHRLVVDYSEVGGEESVSLEIEGPKVARQPIANWLTLNEDGSPPKKEVEAASTESPGEAKFEFNADLVAKGAGLFRNLGCASCHELKREIDDNGPLQAIPTLAKCDPAKGCLADERPKNVPNFDLNDGQRAAVAAFLSDDAVSPTSAADNIVHTMKNLNCYACHQRGSIGGPEPDRHAQFVSQIPEMGDEGRIPPALDGVGDKLQEGWLRQIVTNGAKDRPYMTTRMPKFGAAAGHLVPALLKADRTAVEPIVKVDDATHRIKADGRKLVGSEGLSCVKCHTFGRYKATGIQAIDLQSMTKRLNEDWFHRYLPNPAALRPGTRMPTAFPNGKSVVTEIYEGHPDQQVAAIWEYLKDGAKAPVPEGVMGGMIELKPDTKPIIYRNFLEGLSARGIAVGYPEGANLAWDADSMSLALIWHGRFIDSALHWQGRGQGRQSPLGDHVLRLDQTAAVAVLESRDTPWPASPPKERGYRFLGYRLNAAGQPTFRYRTDDLEIQDSPIPVSMKPDAAFERHIHVSSDNHSSQVYFRAAVGTDIQSEDDGWYVVDNAIRTRIRGDVEPVLRENGGRWELLVPMTPLNGSSAAVQEIVW